MGNPREKGKIPHAKWPEIVARYGNGESIASIARDYHCTAPAIRYIVRRQPSEQNVVAGPETNVQESVPGAPGFGASDVGVTGSPAPGAKEGRRAARGIVLTDPVEPVAAPGPRRGTGDETAQRTGISPDLRRRIAGEISLFLVALDTALLDGSPNRLNALRDAADRLMRATAHIYIELGR